MLSCFIAVILLTVTALSLSVSFRKSFTDILAPVVFGVIILLYGFYIANHLFLGRSIVILLMLLTIFYTWIRNRSALSEMKALISSRYFALYILGIFIFFLFSWNKFVSHYDSLRLWGAYPKALHTTGSLQLGEGSLLYPVMQSYPPGMPLLCYFFSSFSPVFSENSLFFTYNFFGFSLMLPFLSRAEEQGKRASLLIFLAILFVPYLISGMNDDGGYYYSSLFIDIPLGICCGYFFSRAFHPRNKLDMVCAALSCGILVLLKDSGAFLALCGIIGSLICNFVKAEKQSRKALFIFLVCEALLLLLTYGTWKYCQNVFGVVRKIQPTFHIPSVRTLGLLFLHFIKTPVTGILTVTGAVHISLPAALITIFAVKFLLAKHDPHCHTHAHIVDIAVQFLCYAGFFLGYCFSFLDQIEKMVYPSYSRYHCTLLICALYILAHDCRNYHQTYLASLFRELLQKFKNSSFSELFSSAFTIFRLGIVICLIFSTLLILFYHPSKAEPFYTKSKESAIVASVSIPKNSTVYLCMPDASDENILIQHRLYFELIDEEICIPNYLDSIDITEKGIGYSCDEFITHLLDNQFDYVMLTGVSDPLISEFGSLFGDISTEETNLIYQVDAENRQLIRIR